MRRTTKCVWTGQTVYTQENSIAVGVCPTIIVHFKMLGAAGVSQYKHHNNVCSEGVKGGAPQQCVQRGSEGWGTGAMLDQSDTRVCLIAHKGSFTKQ